jgi:hypothetical protein
MVRFGCYSIGLTASDGSSVAEIKGAHQAGDDTLVLCGRPASCGCRGGHCGMSSEMQRFEGLCGVR